jgi:hypothetical protein
MTDYVKSTNFASKDSLSIGNPLKIVKGTEIDTEFNNIATAVATKADIANPTFTGVPAAPTAASGTNTTQLATTAFVTAAVTAYDTALTVSTTQIENDAVTTIKIADLNVTTDKIADVNVTTAKIANGNITEAKIATGAVTVNKIDQGAVTGAKLSGAQTGSAPVYGARAWVNFNGTGTVAIRESGNVSSITDNGVGDYTINFSTAMPDANYATIGSAGVGGFNGVYLAAQSGDGTRGIQTTAATQIRTLVGGNSSAGAYDASFVLVSIFR